MNFFYGCVTAWLSGISNKSYCIFSGILICVRRTEHIRSVTQFAGNAKIPMIGESAEISEAFISESDRASLAFYDLISKITYNLNDTRNNVELEISVMRLDQCSISEFLHADPNYKLT